MTETKQFPEIVLCLQQTFLETAALCANTTSINKQALAQSQAFFRNENSKQCEEESAYPSLWLRILGASPSFLTETDDAIATDCSLDKLFLKASVAFVCYALLQGMLDLNTVASELQVEKHYVCPSFLSLLNLLLFDTNHHSLVANAHHFVALMPHTSLIAWQRCIHRFFSMMHHFLNLPSSNDKNMN